MKSLNIDLSRNNHVPDYIFSRLAKAVTEVEEAKGRKVLNLGPGSPDFPPSSVYTKKLAQLVKKHGAHLYPGYQAIPEFSSALSQWYQSRFSVELEKSEILPLLGAKDGISHLPLALLDPGDEILVPNPGYPAFSGTAQLVGAKPVPYDLSAEDNFQINISNLEVKLTKKTRCIWVNFPSNPTGHVATLSELEPVVTFCKNHKIVLLYDNAYSEITFDGVVAPSILQIDDAKDVAVEVGSFSKSHSFAGFRMGWIVGNASVITTLAKVKSQFDSGLSLPLQQLGAFTLQNQDEEWHKKMITSYQERRAILAKKLSALELKFSLPEGGLYLWAKIPESAVNSEVFSMNLLQQQQIFLTPGSAFGSNGDRNVRVSICSDISQIDSYV